jgi:hypothetical protein
MLYKISVLFKNWTKFLTNSFWRNRVFYDWKTSKKLQIEKVKSFDISKKQTLQTTFQGYLDIYVLTWNCSTDF